jgi:hypothetical protein
LDVSTAQESELAGIDRLISGELEHAVVARAEGRSRQRRTIALMRPFNDVCAKLESVSRGDGRASLDVSYLTLLFIDALSERMVTAEGMSDEEARAHLAENAVRLDRSLTVDAAKKMAGHVIEALANADDRLRQFVVTYHCPVEGREQSLQFAYLRFETIDGVGTWRLTQDGMRVTLRALDISEDDGEIEEFLMQRALDRGAFDDVMRQTDAIHKRCIHFSAQIKSRLRDAEFGSDIEWDGTEVILKEARAMVVARRSGTEKIGNRIRELLENESEKLSQEIVETLQTAGHIITRVQQQYSKLNTLLMRTPVAFGETMLSQIGRNLSQTVMPDLFREVLVPFLSSRASIANAAVDDIASGLYYRPIPKLIDLHRIIDEMEGLVEDFSRSKAATDRDNAELVDDDDSPRLRDVAVAQAVVNELIEDAGTEGIRVSDLCRAIVAEDIAMARPMTVYSLVGAILKDDSDEFEVIETGGEFDIPGILSGTDFLIRRRRQDGDEV